MDPLREIGVAISTNTLPENNVDTPSLQLITSNGTIVSNKNILMTGEGGRVPNLTLICGIFSRSIQIQEIGR